MQYIDIVRNTEGVDSFKANQENLVEQDYDKFTSKLSRGIDEFNKNIAKAKGNLDWAKGLVGLDKNFTTAKDSNGRTILSKEDKYLQEQALPRINGIIESYMEQGKIDEQKFKQQLGQISKDFISFMEGKNPIDYAKGNTAGNPLSDYFSGNTTKKKLDAAGL